MVEAGEFSGFVVAFIVLSKRVESPLWKMLNKLGKNSPSAIHPETP